MIVLIIEDDETLAELIREKVEEGGYDTACLQSAADAFAWLTVHIPYIMLLDYTLPDMNAREFIAGLKRNKQAVPPFIISTGQGDERIAVEMMKLGARDYIVKDGNFLDLLPEVLRRVDREIENETKVKEQQERLKNVIEGTRLGTWEWNVQTGDVVVNERSAEIVGYTLNELMPINIDVWNRFAHPDDLEKSFDSVRQHFKKETEYCEFENRMKHKDGRWIWILNRGRVIEWNSDGKPVRMFGFHMDITEKKEMYEKIEELSIRDPLTNLYNRRYIFNRLEMIVSEYLRERKNFTVSIIDIDHFKDVNDKYGHQAGDLVLSEFAGIISGSLRPYDLPGRYGGEEFIIISMNVGKEQTRSRIELILDTIRSRKFVYKDNEICFTFSCGISESFELEEVTVASLIETADKRLYEAKKTGRDRITIIS